MGKKRKLNTKNINDSNINMQVTDDNPKLKMKKNLLPKETPTEYIHPLNNEKSKNVKPDTNISDLETRQSSACVKNEPVDEKPQDMMCTSENKLRKKLNNLRASSASVKNEPVEEKPQDVMSTSKNKRRKKKNKKSKSMNKDEDDLNDEEIDKFCDELTENDNEEYEHWIKLLDDKLKNSKET